MTIRASEFYRRMKELDEIREDGIEVLKDKGIILPEDSSFREIVEGIKNIESVKEEEEKEELFPEIPGEETEIPVYITTEKRAIVGICDKEGNVIEKSILDGNEEYEVERFSAINSGDFLGFRIETAKGSMELLENVFVGVPTRTFGIEILSDNLITGDNAFIKEGWSYKVPVGKSGTIIAIAEFNIQADEENNLFLSICDDTTDNGVGTNTFSLFIDGEKKLSISGTKLNKLDDEIEIGEIPAGGHTLRVEFEDYRVNTNIYVSNLSFSFSSITTAKGYETVVVKGDKTIIPLNPIPDKITEKVMTFFEKYKTLSYLYGGNGKYITSDIKYLGEHNTRPLFLYGKNSGLNLKNAFVSSSLQKSILPLNGKYYTLISNPGSFSGEALIWDNGFKTVSLPNDFSENELYFQENTTTADGETYKQIKKFIGDFSFAKTSVPYAVYRGECKTYIPGTVRDPLEYGEGKIIYSNDDIWPLGLFEICPYADVQGHFVPELKDKSLLGNNVRFVPMKNNEELLDPFKNDEKLFLSIFNDVPPSSPFGDLDVNLRTHVIQLSARNIKTDFSEGFGSFAFNHNKAYDSSHWSAVCYYAFRI